MPRTSRQSVAATPISDLGHDLTAVALQEALGVRVLLIRALGQGGMGRVYLGRDPQLKRFVAVKVLMQSLGTDAEAHARFQREAQAIAAVSHPNVVAIYGIGELPDGTPYFVMQHVSGGSMAERLFAKGPLPIDAAEGILGDVAAALAAAHKRGIVHRDVKPANVLWDEDGERATVTDFGIAAIFSVEGDESELHITASGMTVGSPAYMSPEQLLTEPVTPKSDVYALGLLGYELLTGHGPFQAIKPSDIVAAHLRDTPRRLSELRPDVPPLLEDLLLRCLSKQPEERPTAEEVMLAMTPGAAEALEWPPPGLERARAALWRLVFMPAVGTLFLLFPLLLLVKLGRWGIVEGTLVWPSVLAGLSLLGFAAFARGGLRAYRTGRGLLAGSRLGYGWGTLAEVMSDRRGDTGALIAGTREYGGLSAEERARFRVLRVAEATLVFLAAPAALVAAVIALVLRGGRSGGDGFFVSAVLVTLLTLAACGVLASLFERVRLAKTRRKRTELPRRTNERELAPAWYAAFERSREGQRFGQGPAVNRVAARILVVVGTGTVIFCAMVILMASVITVTGQILNDLVGGSQYAWLTSNAQRSTGGATYRLPADGQTSPIEAGDALLAVAATDKRRRPSPIERQASSDYPHWNRVVPPAAMFPKPKEMLWTTAATLAAGKGLSPEQHTLIERAAAHPARDEFSRASLASALDIYGALLKLPLKQPLHPADYPAVSLWGVREAAESHAARVALDVADKRPADAERHAREIIAIGAMLAETPSVTHNLAGIEIINRGVGSLEAVYVATGRERDARALLDSVVAAHSRQDRFPIQPGLDGLQRAMHNPRFLRGARMEMAVPVLFRSCADPKKLLFGVDESYRSTATYARDSLARFPSEQVFVDGLNGMLSGGTLPSRGAPQGGFFMTMARIVDRVVGGRRFESCASMTPGISSPS